MSVTPTPIFPQALVDGPLILNNGSGTTITSLLTAGTNGTKVDNILVTSTDTSARDVNIYKTISATNYLIGTVSIPAGSGSASADGPSINLLANSQLPFCVDAEGNPYLYLAPGTTLEVGMPVAITSGKQITFLAEGANY